MLSGQELGILFLKFFNDWFNATDYDFVTYLLYFATYVNYPLSKANGLPASQTS